MSSLGQVQEEAQEKDLIARFAARYLRLIGPKRAEKFLSIPDEMQPGHIFWMADTLLTNMTEYPCDKMWRWIGWIQAGCCVAGVTTSTAERDWSRPIMHDYYGRTGRQIPQTRDPEHKPVPGSAADVPHKPRVTAAKQSDDDWEHRRNKDPLDGYGGHYGY